MNPLSPYRKGQRLRADTINALIKIATGQGKIGPPPIPGPDTSPVRVLVKHVGGSSDAVEQFGVMGIEGSVFEHDGNELEFKSHIVLQVDVPATGGSSENDHQGKFVIVQESLEAGDIGVAVIAGVTQVQINVTDEDHQFADVADGDNTQLESGGSGAAKILWKEEGTGTKWAIVNVGAGREAGMFPVRLTTDGGSAGDTSTQCSFTYTVKALDNTTVLAEDVPMTGNGQRIVNSPMNAGTYGMAYYHTDGTLKLMWADETSDQHNCEE